MIKVEKSSETAFYVRCINVKQSHVFCMHQN